MLDILTWRVRKESMMLLTSVINRLSIIKQTSTQNAISHYLNYTLNGERRAEKTYDNRRRILEPFFRKLDIEFLELISIEDIDAAFNSRALAVKQSTYSLERQIIRSFFEFCVERRRVKLQFDYKLITRVKQVYSRRSIPSENEINLAIGNSKPQDALMIQLFVFTGLRLEELSSLQVGDINDTRIHIRGKGQKDRTVYMPRTFARMLELHNQGKSKKDNVFQPLQKHRNTDSSRYRSDTIRERIQRSFEKGGKRYNPHDLRHYFAVNWLLKGGDIRTLQLLLGHDSIETTQVYLQLTDEQTHNNYNKVYARH